MTGETSAARRLRVLLLITAREEGGAERITEDLVSALEDRCDFTVVLPAADGILALASRLSSHARVVTLPLDRPGGLWSAVSQVRELARHADVVHLNSNHPASRLGAILALTVGRAAPVVSVEHQASSPSAVALPALFEPWAGLAFRLSRRRTAVVVAVSHENARRLADEYRIEPARIVTVHNGIDLARFDVPAGQRLARRRELGIADDGQVVVVPARQAPNKGHRFLIAAAPRVLARHPRTLFVLAGAGGPDPRVRAAIDALDLGDAFLDLGFLPHDEMVRTIAAADVLALPSLAEGFSIALLEGMAAGAILVATTVGGAAELITDGEDGFLVPPADADALAASLLKALSLDPAHRARISSRARARSAAFSIQAAASGMLEAYGRAAALQEN